MTLTPIPAAIVIALSCLAGCAADRPAGDPMQSLSPPAAGEQARPAAIIAGAPPTLRYASGVEGDDGSLAITTDASGDTQTTTRLVDAGDAKPGERVLLQTILDDGSIATRREVNKPEGVVIVFDPPLVVLPASVRAGTPFTQSVSMKVHPIKDESRTRAEGTATQEIRFLGRERLTLPGGRTVDTLKLGGTFSADLGPTSVVNESEEWYSEGLGLVAERREERTKVLGVQIRLNRSWWVLKGAD